MIALGLNQVVLLPGSLHWVIQVLHLLTGMAAMGMAERLSTRLVGSQQVARSGV